MAQKIQRKRKVTKAVKDGGAFLLIGGLLAAPFTGGTSLAGSAASVAAMGFTVGTVTLTTGELAMLLGIGGFLTKYAIDRKHKVKIGKDGIEFEPK